MGVNHFFNVMYIIRIFLFFFFNFQIERKGNELYGLYPSFEVLLLVLSACFILLLLIFL
jgi:hypothetical protein